MLEQISEKASLVTTTIQSTLNKSTEIVFDKLKIQDNYNNISNKFADNYKQLEEHYPSITKTLTNTRSVINNGTDYIYSFPTSVGDKVSSIFQPIDGSEEEIPRTDPNNHLADKVIKLNEDRTELVNKILDLYCCKPTKESFKYYDEGVVYEDQILYTSGLANLKAQFYGTTKLLKSTTVDYKILENTLTILRISLSQKYYLPYVYRAFVLNTIVVLSFDDEGKKIIKHTDHFCGQKPIYQGELLRKGAGKIVSTFVKVPSENES